MRRVVGRRALVRGSGPRRWTVRDWWRREWDSLGAPELPWEEHIPLDDGRWLERTDTGGTAPWGERNMPEWWMVMPDGDRRSLGPVFLESAVALTDGRIGWPPV